MDPMIRGSCILTHRFHLSFAIYYNIIPCMASRIRFFKKYCSSGFTDNR